MGAVKDQTSLGAVLTFKSSQYMVFPVISQIDKKQIWKITLKTQPQLPFSIIDNHLKKNLGAVHTDWHSKLCFK